MTAHSKILAFIAKCDDPRKLKKIMLNARAKRESEVADAAFERLIGIVPAEKPGTVEYEFLRTINAFELLLTDERKKTTKLSRTRQKIDRVGIMRTLVDLTMSPKPSAGFEMLIERKMPHYTAEALVLRHISKFDPAVVAAARTRLKKAGISPAAIKET